MNTRRALKVAVAAAEEAGALLHRNLRGVRTIHRKTGRGNLVTDMDHAAEEIIVRRLRRAFPDHQIIAEERAAMRTGSPWRWHIDPLDGTVNYAHGLPHWCVSIGLEDAVAVVYNPNLGEMFTATAGGGARRNGRPIGISRTARLADALVATGFSYHEPARRRNLVHFGRFIQRAGWVRRAGSAALDLCYVAAGIFDGYWELALNSWDLAAGALLVREAGGRLTNLTGGPFDLATGDVLATNGRIHAAMAKVLKTRRGLKNPADLL